MVASEYSVYTAQRPIELLSKVFGFCPQTNLRTKHKFTLFGIIHVAILVSLKVFLIYYNLDPSKFSKATNSTILNSGLWIQTEASLIISIIYILLGIKKCSEKWTLLESYNEIDNEFQKHFHVKYHYAHAKRYISIFIIFGILLHFVLADITAYYIWNLPFEVWHRWSICIAIFLSNICIFSISNQYLCGQLYLSSRFRNINDILSQLMLEKSIGSEVVLLDDKDILVKSAFEPRSQENLMIPNGFETKYSFEKEFPRHISNVSHTNLRSSKQNINSKSISFFLILRKTCVTKLTFTRSSTLTDIIKKLDKLMYLHDRLSDCVDQFNYLLSLEILLICLTIFVYMVFGLFAKYRAWMDYQYEADNVAQMNIYWIIVYCLAVLSGTHVSSSLMQEIRETPVIIHKIACRHQNTIILNKLSRISQMLYSRKTTIECGLVVFDWPIMFTLIASVCMYLIILIQFYLSGRSTKLQLSQDNYENITTFV